MNKMTAKVSPAATSSQDDGLSDLAEMRARGCCPRDPRRHLRRLLWGLVLGAAVALAWAGSTHGAKLVLQRLHAPFFISWFCCSWNLFSYPLYYLLHLAGSGTGARQWPAAHFRLCCGFLGEGGLTLRSLLRGGAPFSLLWSLSCYLYLLALGRISAADASAVLCCSQAFTFLLSWIGLKDTFMGVRIVGSILSITGIVMMAYADGFHSDSITGVALGVGSASTSALYKVLLRKRVGTVQPGPASVLLSCVGLCSSILHSWMCVVLYITHVEYWPSSHSVPWKTLCVLAGLMLTFNVLVNMGGVLTCPTMISLGVLLSIPANTAMDSYLTPAAQLSQVRVSAAGVISLGYLLLLLPERWDDHTLLWLGNLWHGNWREESPASEETAVEPKLKPALV